MYTVVLRLQKKTNRPKFVIKLSSDFMGKLCRVKGSVEYKLIVFTHTLSLSHTQTHTYW